MNRRNFLTKAFGILLVAIGVKSITPVDDEVIWESTTIKEDGTVIAIGKLT